MPAFLISYSTASEETRANLDEFMVALGAVPLADCLCGLEMELELDPFREWLTSQSVSQSVRSERHFGCHRTAPTSWAG